MKSPKDSIFSEVNPVPNGDMIGAELAAWREKHDLTQEQTALALHLSVHTIRGWECNSRGCSLATLLRAMLTLSPTELAILFRRVARKKT